MSPDELLSAIERLPDPPSRFTSSLLARFNELPVSLITALVRAPRSRRRAVNVILEYSFVPYTSFRANIEALEAMYDVLLSESQLLAQAVRPFEWLLRLLGAWDEHSARFEKTLIYLNAELDPLRELIAWDGSLRAELEAGRLPSDPDFQLSWEFFIQRRGSRGVYELDLACPRFEEVPETLIPFLLLPPTEPLPPLSLRGWLTFPLGMIARQLLRQRDLIRRYVMDATAGSRETLLALAKDVPLPQTEELWLLDVEEVKRLDEGWTPDAALLEARRANAGTSIPATHTPQP